MEKGLRGENTRTLPTDGWWGTIRNVGRFCHSFHLSKFEQSGLAKVWNHSTNLESKLSIVDSIFFIIVNLVGLISFEAKHEHMPAKNNTRYEEK